MKKLYDMKSVCCSFQPNDEVLVLLPKPGSALHAKFCGLFSVKEKLSVKEKEKLLHHSVLLFFSVKEKETDYINNTPDRRRKTRVCHVNMLKKFVRDTKLDSPCTPATLKSVVVRGVMSIQS